MKSLIMTELIFIVDVNMSYSFELKQQICHCIETYNYLLYLIIIFKRIKNVYRYSCFVKQFCFVRQKLISFFLHLMIKVFVNFISSEIVLTFLGVYF